LSEDGGRLHRKRNLGVLVEAAPDAVIEAPPSFRWMSLWQIKALLDRNAWVNPHVRGIIAGL
jgi:oxidase EvaA